MKIFIKSILTIGLCLVVANAEVIWPISNDEEAFGKTAILTEFEANNALRIIESMPWIEEGEQEGEGKYLYALYSPYLDESKDFYEKTRPYLNDINIRWIPVDVAYNITGLLEDRSPLALEKAIAEKSFPEVKNKLYTDSIANATFTGFIYLRAVGALSPQSKDYLPTVLYGNNDKLFVTILPDNLQDKDVKDIISNIPLSIPNTQQPSILELSKKVFKLTKIEEGNFYSNTSKHIVSAFLYPDEQGIEIGAFNFGEPNPPFPVKAVTDNGYLAIDLNGRGNYIYIQDVENRFGK